jgi:ergothioneine biosynthesis protein EgtB
MSNELSEALSADSQEFAMDGNNTDLWQQYKTIRKKTEEICAPLQAEDYVVQPIVDVSPPKWHLGHTTWFFETFVLEAYEEGYKENREFNKDYNFIFNSYYESIGSRVIRTDRGNLSRPTVEEIYAYRKHVDSAMKRYLQNNAIDEKVRATIELGLNHEQQHQELLYTDIKYILGHNPLFPAYDQNNIENTPYDVEEGYVNIEAGVYEIGYEGDGFHFDNEKKRHKCFVDNISVSKKLVTNGEYLEFINDGGYRSFGCWHAEAWEWLRNNDINSPLYWHFVHGKWHVYTLAGLKPLNPDEPVTHISYYEASAYARWKGMRLLKEEEWEVAAQQLNWGDRWEWTESAYLPYPGYAKADGAIGEYNGKFMVNQMVLRGASIATPENHSRISYRNFFHPHLRWQYTGIRLAK